MGFVSSLLSNDKGAGFQADKADIQMPVSEAQANTAYDQSQTGLSNQAAFLAALQAQGGIGNQSQVYNQLQGIANGTGPNAAQTALNNNTAQNVAQTAALMAGARGSSANAGEIARQVGQQGAAVQQNAVGQAAALQAQQQQAAINAAGSLANQQVANQANATTGYSQAAQSEQANLLGAISNQNNANVGMQSNRNSTNGAIANTNAGFQGQLFGGALNGAAAALAKGGMVPAKTAGGPTSNAGQFLYGAATQTAPTPIFTGMNPSVMTPSQSGGYQAGSAIGGGIGKGLKSMFGGSAAPAAPTSYEPDTIGYGAAGSMASAPAIAAPDVGMAFMAAAGGAMPMKRFDTSKPAEQLKTGGKVPGKPKVKGNNLKNDTVPAMLSPGEVVIPNDVMQSKDPVGNAAKFVHAVMMKKQKA